MAQSTLSKPKLYQAVERHSGYDCILTDGAKQGMLCPECNKILREAVQTGDGVRLCKPCFEYIASFPKYVSPKTNISVVGEEGKPECYPDKAVQRQVLQLVVKCKHKPYGCPWENKIVNYDGHFIECKYVPVECSNEGCDKLLSLDQLQQHLADDCNYSSIPCKHCGDQCLRKDLDEHYENCPMLPVICEQCKKEITRDKVDEHNLNDCETVKCSCKALLKRNAPESEKNSIHSHLAKPVDVFFHILSITTLLNNVMRKQSDFDRRLTAMETGNTKASKRAQKEDLNQHRAEIEQNFKRISDRLAPLEQVPVDKNLVGKIRDLQKKVNQLETKNSQQELLITKLQTQMQQRAVSSHLSTHTDNCSHVDTSRVSHVEKMSEDLEKQVSLLKVHVSELELQLQASLASTHNGSFLWRIPDISRRRRDGIEERITSIYSPPFYTGRNGYKMCIRAYLNGDGMGYRTHLSLFFVIMKGEFDALLRWPFDYKVSLILVDQNHKKHIVQTFKPTPESNSFQRPISDMNVASGCPQFAKLSVLDDPAYVKDDVLFVKCIVDTTRIFHP